MDGTAREHLDGSRILDVAVDARVEHGASVTIRHGGLQAAARTSWLGGPFHQLRLDVPLTTSRGDRISLLGARDGRPLADAVVLDPSARRHGTGNDVLIHLRRLLEDQQGTGGAAPPPDDELALRVAARLREAGVDAPSDDELSEGERAALAFLRDAGRVVRLGPASHVHARVLAEVEEQVRATIAAEGSVTVAGLARLLGTSDERALLLLELLDAERVTVPQGDARVLRRRRLT